MELRRRASRTPAYSGAMERMPREAFVPETFRDQAYEDTALPIGHGQTISQPPWSP
jgi:protein-L-isoaspartate(D-aspartate) O-methyltransferase